LSKQITSEIDFTLRSCDSTSNPTFSRYLHNLVLLRVKEWNFCWLDVRDFFALLLSVEVAVLGYSFSMDFAVI
jgi:hypothetical protein